MFVFKVRLFLFLFATVLLAGCGAEKLKFEKEFTLPTDAEHVKQYTLPAQSADQTIKVEVTATKAVDVFVIPAKDAPDLDTATTKDFQAKAVASKLGVTNDTFTAKVPAKQEVKVVVTLSTKTDKTQVKLKMTN